MWLLVALIILVWPIFFVALWSAIVAMMSLVSGWRRLARVYRTIEPPAGGKTTRSVTGMVGAARYKRVLTIATDDRGMFVTISWIFRMGHPSLFIPWRDIHNARKMNLFYWQFIAFDIGSPRIAGMRLPSDIFVGTPVFID